MKSKSIRKTKGMTLLELTVVILVLLSLIAILFIGATAWKAGADRSGCLITIRNVQQGVRSYANMNNIAPGEPSEWPALVIGPGKFVESVNPGALNNCPGGGEYAISPDTKIPPMGKIAATCKLADDKDHKIPATETAGW